MYADLHCINLDRWVAFIYHNGSLGSNPDISQKSINGILELVYKEDILKESSLVQSLVTLSLLQADGIYLYSTESQCAQPELLHWGER